MATIIKKRAKISLLWNFFTPLEKNYAKCNLCRAKLSYKSTTTNLKKHILFKHPTVKLPILTGFSKKSTTPKLSVPSPKENCQTDEDIEIEETHLEVSDIKEEHTEHTLPDTVEPSCPAVTNLNRLHPSTIEPSCPAVTNLERPRPSVTQEDSPGEKPFDIFGKYVAAELHQLSERHAILVQQEIQNCITKARLACLDDKSSSPVEVMYIDVRPSISSNLIESTCKDSNDAVFNN